MERIRELRHAPVLGVRRQGCDNLVVTAKAEKGGLVGHGVKVFQ